MAKVVLAYWAPVYVTVDTEQAEVSNMRLAMNGMRTGARVTGQPVEQQAAAARIFAEARVEKRLPALEVG